MMSNDASILLVLYLFKKNKKAVRTKSTRNSIERKLYSLYGSDADEIIDAFEVKIDMLNNSEVNVSVGDNRSVERDFNNQMEEDPEMKAAFEKMLYSQT